jgi:hypothetical protein
MTTDTALGVTKICVQDQSEPASSSPFRCSLSTSFFLSTVPLSKIPFVDNPTIRFDAVESVEMPFRYVTDAAGEPILPEGMRELLRRVWISSPMAVDC